jgi:hypothetical protein
VLRGEQRTYVRFTTKFYFFALAKSLRSWLRPLSYKFLALTNGPWTLTLRRFESGDPSWGFIRGVSNTTIA